MARIVFDLDGTLIDSAPDIHNVANSVLKAVGGISITLQDTRTFIGNGASVFVEKMRKARNIPDEKHPEMLASFIEQYETAVDLTKPYANLVETLQLLKRNEHRLGICTNKPIGATHAVLKHLELTDNFETVWGGDSLSVRKPDAAPLIAAFNALDVGSQIYVGDSEVDSETAQNAKVPFVLFTEGYRKKPVQEVPHMAKFSDYSELPEIIENLL